MSFNIAVDKVASASKYDLLEMSITLDGESETGLYLLLDNFNKTSDCFRVLPMKGYSDESNDHINIPAISMPSYMVNSYKKVKDESILYFVDNSNPHIINAIKKYFKKKQKNEKHRSR
tara:strand:+ start:307 stop:660 length:354 start_codon:yes stop_codon:yes gene_type:complete